MSAMVCAGGGLAGEHDAAGAVKDGVGHVGHLGAGGPGVADHGVQHLGGGDDVLACPDGGLDHPLLEDGHLVGGDLHAQIAPGNHDAVGGGDDAVQIVHALPVLDFGDDADGLSAALVEESADLRHVGGPADEGGGDEVKVVLHGEAQVVPVPVGEGGQGDGHAGDVDALVVGEDAASDDGAVDVVAAHLRHLQLHKAVVDEHPAARLQLVAEVDVGDGNTGPVAGHVVGGEGEGRACRQRHRAVREGTDADLRAFGVQNGGHRAAQIVPDALKAGEHGQMRFVSAVGEVEPGGVHAGQNELFHGGLVARGGAEGADDFCFSHNDPPVALTEGGIYSAFKQSNHTMFRSVWQYRRM